MRASRTPRRTWPGPSRTTTPAGSTRRSGGCRPTSSSGSGKGTIGRGRGRHYDGGDRAPDPPKIDLKIVLNLGGPDQHARPDRPPEPPPSAAAVPGRREEACPTRSAPGASARCSGSSGQAGGGMPDPIGPRSLRPVQRQFRAGGRRHARPDRPPEPPPGAAAVPGRREEACPTRSAHCG